MIGCWLDYATGTFQGFGANGESRDWQDWEGGCHGCEGLLVDNYYALLAVFDDVKDQAAVNRLVACLLLDVISTPSYLAAARTEKTLTAADICRQAEAFHRQGRFDEAIAEYQKATNVDAQFHPAWYAQGCAFEAKQNPTQALACFQRAVSLAPNHRESHHNLGKALFGLGMVDEALGSFETALSLGGGFLPRTAIAVVIPGSPRATNETILTARRAWAETHLPKLPMASKPPREPIQGRPMRVAYLSSFFAQQKWMKPVWGLINHHDRERIEVHLFSDAAESECEPAYRKHPADRFHNISGLSNQEVARQIEKSSPDLLVDLNGYSRVERLAVVALKPAPVVAGWFNFYATSGMACYDFLVGDEEVVPPTEEVYYSERILRVPGSYLTFEVCHAVPDVVDPPGLGTRNLTFGCLASAYKITPPVIEAWSRILQRAPGATLFLKNAALDCPDGRQFLARRFAQCGIGSERLVMSGRAEHFDFLAAYGRIDVALDTFPYNGGTTTMEALWQGVPVLTFRGDRWAARQSASILHAGGLSDFVAESVEEYVERAVGLAQSSESLRRLSELRRAMRQQLASATLCDTASFARHMEALYGEMVARKSLAP